MRKLPLLFLFFLLLAIGCATATRPPPETVGAAPRPADSSAPADAACPSYAGGGDATRPGYFPIDVEPTRRPRPSPNVKSTPTAVPTAALVGKVCTCGNGKAESCAVSDGGGCTGVGHPCDPGPTKVRNVSEACDGADLRGETCESLGYGPGVLTCADCIPDVSRCGVCPSGAACVDIGTPAVAGLVANDQRLFAWSEEGVTRFDEKLHHGPREEGTQPYQIAVTATGAWMTDARDSERRALAFLPNDGPLRKAAWSAPQGERLDGLFTVRDAHGALEDAVAFTTDYASKKWMLHVLSATPRAIRIKGDAITPRPGEVIHTAGAWFFQPTERELLGVDGEGTQVRHAIPRRCAVSSLIATPAGIFASTVGALQKVDDSLQTYGPDLLPPADGKFAYSMYGQAPPLVFASGAPIASLGEDTWIAFLADGPLGFRLFPEPWGNPGAVSFRGRLAVTWSVGKAMIAFFDVPKRSAPRK